MPRDPSRQRVQELERKYREGRMRAYTFDPGHLVKKPVPAFKAAALAEDVWAGDSIDELKQNGEVFLWRFYEKAAGKPFIPYYQTRGICVTCANTASARLVAAVSFVVAGTRWPGDFAMAPGYAGGRVEIAGRPGRWDGSNTSWQSDFLVKYGCVTLKELNLPLDPKDSERQDERLAVQWAASSEGVPREIEGLARKRPIKKRLHCRNTLEIAAAVQAGAPVSTGSGTIPSGSRNRDGFARCQSGGGHAEHFSAVRFDPFGLFLQNSWSPTWGSGGKYPADQPDGGRWIDEACANRIAREMDCYALVGISGVEPLKKQTGDLGW